MKTSGLANYPLADQGTDVAPVLRTIRLERLTVSGGGTVDQNRKLEVSARRFFVVVVASMNEQYGEINHATAVGLWYRLNRLVAWMTERETWAFSDLMPADLEAFMASIKNRHGLNIAIGTAKKYFSLFSLLYSHRGSYPSSLKKDLQADLRFQSSKRKFGRAQPWQPIADAKAISLIADALAWTASFGAITKDWAARVWAVRLRQEGQSQNARLQTSAAELSLIAASDNFKSVAAALGMKGCLRARVVEVAIATTQKAVLTQILFLVGMRISEVLALRIGCLVKRKLLNGDPVWYVEGVAAKARGRSRAWVVPDAVRDGIELLISLAADVRRNFGFSYLFVARIGVLPHIGGSLRRLKGDRGAMMLKSFASSPYRVTPWNQSSRLHPHQARKTFASMVVRRNKNALQPLAHHYGHVNYAITDKNYAGADFQLAELLKSQDRADLADCLIDILSSSNIAGKAAAVLDASLPLKEAKPAFRGKRGLERMVEELIDRGVHLAPCDWGYCVYSQSHSACRGDAQGPNHVRRCPDVCSTCSNFLTTENHRPFWEARCKDDLLFLRRPGLCEQTVRIVEQRSRNSEKVLSGLNAHAHPVGSSASEKS